MFIAVLLYKDIANKPVGIPDAWPAEVRQLGSSRALPGPDWILMRCSDLPNYKVRFQEAYDLYQSTIVIEAADVIEE